MTCILEVVTTLDCAFSGLAHRSPSSQSRSLSYWLLSIISCCQEPQEILVEPQLALWLPFAHPCLSLRLYTLISRRDQLYGLWSAHAFTIPIGVLVFPLGYLLCFYPVIKVALAVCKRVGLVCFKPRVSSRQTEVPNLTKLATAPNSDRVSQPSDTFFIVPHPDVLTETSPLISDTGYGSSATFQYSQHK